MEYLWDIIKTIISCGLSFGLGLMTMLLTRRHDKAERIVEAQRKENKEMAKRQEAVNLGVLALIRKALIDAYDNYVLHKCPLTVERRHEVDQLFKAYERLGGNGTVAHLYEEIVRCSTEIIGIDDAEALSHVGAS